MLDDAIMKLHIKKCSHQTNRQTNPNYIDIWVEENRIIMTSKLPLYITLCLVCFSVKLWLLIIFY